jgi:hypothetical protein
VRGQRACEGGGGAVSGEQTGAHEMAGSPPAHTGRQAAPPPTVPMGAVVVSSSWPCAVWYVTSWNRSMRCT